MDKAEEFVRQLMRMHKTASVNHIGKVISIEGKTCDVEPVDGGATITGVRLQPVIDTSNEGLLITPEQNSYVMVSEVFINKSESKFYLAAVSRVQEIRMITASGDVYSLTKTEELIKELNKTNQVVEAIANILTNWVVVPTDGGAALKALVAPALTGKTVGNFANIKNERIKHA